MRAWREKFQAMAMAVAFAEQAEWETAKSLIESTRPQVEDTPADVKKRPKRRLRQRLYRT